MIVFTPPDKMAEAQQRMSSLYKVEPPVGKGQPRKSGGKADQAPREAVKAVQENE